MIRPMNQQDFEAILALDNRCFSKGYTSEQLKYEFAENPYAKIYVFQDGDKIKGYYDLWIIFENSEINRIAVDPEEQSKGIGYLLMQHLEQTAMENGCENISLEVRVNNEKAIGLYKKCGFIDIGVKKDYYHDEHGYTDANRMMKGI